LAKLAKRSRSGHTRILVVLCLFCAIAAGACTAKKSRPFEENREIEGLIAVAAERPDGTVERVRIVTSRHSYIVHDSEKGPSLRKWPGRRATVTGRVYEVEGVRTIVVTDYDLDKSP
jgi:hypothetical protein